MGRNRNVTPDEVQYVRTNCMVKGIDEMAMDLHRNYWTIHRARFMWQYALKPIGKADLHYLTKIIA